LSLHEIACELGVAYTTARRWTLDVELTQGHLSRLARRVVEGRQAGNAAVAERAREKRLSWQEEGRSKAREGDALHMAGCMLYWAEGTKGRNRLEMSNSDVHLLRLFRRFLDECFEVSPSAMTLTVHVYLGNGIGIGEIERYWLTALDLPESCLRKPQVNKRPAATSGVKAGKLPYGVANLGVAQSTSLIQHIYGAIQEYGGFDEPRWLDLARKRAAPTPPASRDPQR
jgi:hypothetical protein